MGYVFGKAFWWILLALLIGGVIGYYWNGWRKKRWIDSTSSSVSSSSGAAATGTDLDAVDENQRLRTRIAELQADHDQMTSRIAELEADLDDCRAQRAAVPDGMAPAVQGFASLPENRFADVEYDLDAAAAALGGRVKMDDLKVVEGIGPKIEELIHGGGITTWAELADAPVERLQEILDAAGERYRIHDPGTWPRQAELLASAKWDEFKQLTDELDGGRE